MDDEVVWLFEQKRYAILVARHAFHSIVRYEDDGLDHEVEVLNEEYEFWEERAIDYESE